MKITDSFSDILALANEGFTLEGWERYVARISPTLPKKLLEDSASYDMDTQVMPVIRTALDSRKKLEQAHVSFLAATQTLQARFVKVFGVDLDVHIILYLGLCNGAGWATALDGQKTVFLGIEKIVELDWCDEKTMASLINHELGHIWHDTVGALRRDAKNAGEKWAWQLFQEGIAMVCEQLLCGDMNAYHQDKNGWLGWCSQNRALLFSEFARRVDANESAQDFFGDWRSYLGHSDAGYYLGCEFVKALMARYALCEVARLDIPNVIRELRSQAS